MKTRNLLAATALALLPTAGFASESNTITRKELRCRVGNAKGASYEKNLGDCLKARALGKKIAFDVVEVPVRQELAKKQGPK